ncbi:hypothetical protein PENSUB_1652 [Penicillium subrubescens]|uniref:Uncharacterized protein n=1 Tax=Penicillium subrubescens TaxID=1316194 RepID=A0A1Q5UJT0_9EURO|nr:hypothetical protein PENSUB_1652 [Penicillium subrubescens]
MRESESDLKEAMKAKSFLINDRIGACSLLDIAFGWPRGIQILLEAGADAHDYAIRFVEDTESKITYDSVKILLQAGCKFSFVDIEQCNQVPNGDSHEDLGFWLRETVAFVLIWIGESRKVCQEIIRFFTFDALSLTHVCCVDEWNRHFCCSRLQTRNRREVEEILDEEKLGVGNLEKLVAEVNEKFDELGFPIIVFLQGHWYSRIVEFLSERDPYDEEHHVELGKIGVKLEAEEWVLPDRVALLIRPNVEEIVDA